MGGQADEDLQVWDTPNHPVMLEPSVRTCPLMSAKRSHIH